MTDLAHWQSCPLPPHAPLAGRFVSLEPLDPARHADQLWTALQAPPADPQQWQYMAYGPFAARAEFDAWLAGVAVGSDPLFFAVRDHASGNVVGQLALMRITPAHGCVEIGHVLFAPPLQRTPGASEAIYLLARLVFALGYRRLEWKCDADNTRSRRAAERLGFVAEGLFRQHLVVKGRNRDTAWYALLDGDWPRCRAAFERWLAADNFDAEGRQRRGLAELRDE
ncbi:GNAT family N-acetyltransferase [Pseudomonas sp. GCM10022188]|uniref:GNAT family N-acetyltransferase n=1 Tax=Pseudomonas TaxID=286 RepID=UPI001E603026|nr:GNAT family protein [Pseudomonas oryzagri]MCC6075757.1 GNAT family N-acetyltransferase [Pseudomonas oryzagri]